MVRYEQTPDGCWRWLGWCDKQGYGRSGPRLAHRMLYEEKVGPIPAGLELDHLCRNPSCVNPEHLEPVTRAENMRRRYETYNHCVHGHELTPDNTYSVPGSVRRECRECRNDRSLRYYNLRRRVGGPR